ncbi:MAG: hypothetical protein CM15mP83_9470 [Flavobacteriaceae bacterium]|nr:MAG: hypothetical protein CM15mP83_9470 [Flavobacteriaceae bacterium]
MDFRTQFKLMSDEDPPLNISAIFGLFQYNLFKKGVFSLNSF